MTEAGPAPWLAEWGSAEYPEGETEAERYQARRRRCVKDYDAAMIFGDITMPGSKADSIWLEEATSPASDGLRRVLVEIESGGLRGFECKQFSRAGDHYVINGHGGLELRDDHGLIAVARRIR